MNATPKKLTAVIAGSAVLASAAYGVGTQVGGGNATAANNSGSSSSTADRPGPGRPDLSGLADQLGVSEAKLRAALQDLRADRPARDKRGGDIAAALAKELDVSEAQVRASSTISVRVAAVVPARPASRGRWPRSWASAPPRCARRSPSRRATGAARRSSTISPRTSA